MGALYVGEIDDDSETEDINNNFLIDLDTIDLTKEDIDIEATGMEKQDGTT